MFSKTIVPSLFLVIASLALMPSCKKTNTQPAPIQPAPTQPAPVLTEQEILDKVLTLPQAAFNYSNIALPSYLNTVGMQSFDNTPASNPITDNGATLGRVLFYDKILSANNTTSCASCHKQANSFADTSQFSIGFAKGKTTRNAMTLVNAKYYPPGSFFWDQRAATLEEQVLMPIQNQVEMGLTLDVVESRLAQKDYYKILFKRAFGDTTITRGKISLALAQFVRSLVSFQSKYDAGLVIPQDQNGGFGNFTTQENNGKHLFQNHCGRCHGTALQIATQARNNGLDLVYTDNGVGGITKDAADNGKFKTPSLRNVAVTAPYMHDGRYATLEQVVAFYSDSVRGNSNLDKSLGTPPPNSQPLRLNLTQAQKDEIVAFLKTLTDNQFLTDVKYSNPFKK